jgi:hypothetical protein
MIKTIALVQCVLSLLISVGLLIFMNEKVAISCAVTSVLLIANLIGLYIFWRVVFFKKSIALGLLIIIFKYPLIAFCLWQMSKQTWVQPIGILVAMLLFLFSVVSGALYTQRRTHAF